MVKCVSIMMICDANVLSDTDKPVMHKSFVASVPMELGIAGWGGIAGLDYQVFSSALSPYTRGVQKIRGQMLPFPQFLTEPRETFT